MLLVKVGDMGKRKYDYYLWKVLVYAETTEEPTEYVC